jgi:hypothetical protein
VEDFRWHVSLLACSISHHFKQLGFDTCCCPHFAEVVNGLVEARRLAISVTVVKSSHSIGSRLTVGWSAFNPLITTFAHKNYPTKAPAMQSVGRVQEALIARGAVRIQTMYDADKRIWALQFALPFKDGKKHRVLASLRMAALSASITPAECAPVGGRRICVSGGLGRYPRLGRLTDGPETQMVDMPQIFLPFAVGKEGRTLYEYVQTNPGFLLGLGDGH